MDQEFRAQERSARQNPSSEVARRALAQAHWRAGRLFEAYEVFQSLGYTGEEDEIQPLCAALADIQRPYLESFPDHWLPGHMRLRPPFENKPLSLPYAIQSKSLVSALEISNVAPVSPEELQRIQSIPFLQALHLNYDSQAEDFEALSDFPHLRQLRLYCDEFTEELAKRILALPKLQQINARVRRPGLSHFVTLQSSPSLEYVQLSTTYADNLDLADLSRFSTLKSLYIDSGDYDQRGLEALAQSPSLQRLFLVDSEHAQSLDFSVLERVRSLRYLDLGSEEFSAAQLRTLGQLTQLSALVLDYIPAVDSSVIQEIGRLKDLILLSLKGANIDDTALPALAELTRLQELYLKRSSVTREGLRALQDLPAISLILWSGGYYDKGSHGPLPEFLDSSPESF